MSYTFQSERELKYYNLEIINQKLQKMIEENPFDHLGNVSLDVQALATIGHGRRMLFELESRIAAKRLDRQFVKYPANWWEHFKQDKLAQWRITRRYVEKHPVQYMVKRFDVAALYPDIPLKDHAHYVAVLDEEEYNPWHRSE